MGPVAKEQEFACWLSSYKVTKDTASKMPQGLPSSDSLPVYPPQNLINLNPKTAYGTQTPSLDQTKIESKIITSLSQTIHTSVASSLAQAGITTHSSKTIDVVVKPSAPDSVPVSFALIHTNSPPLSPTKCEYKLSELVTREKDKLFQIGDSDLELEPPRPEVYSVRRRSRQFFTPLVEDEEVDFEGKTREHALPSDLKPNIEETVQVDPVLNLGESLRRLYFPEEYKKHKKHKKVYKHKDQTEEHIYRAPSTSGEASSDSELQLGLYEKVKNNPALRKVMSHPEMDEMEELRELYSGMDDPFGIGKSKSLPVTPRVSPKLKRRDSLNTDHEIEKRGPGFSFLASVAGDLRLKKFKQEKKMETGVVKTEGVIVKMPQAQLVKRTSDPDMQMNRASTETTQSLPSRPICHSHVSEFSEYVSDHGSSDSESEKPKFIKSFIKWGTKKKVKVTNKESNMMFPTSF